MSMSHFKDCATTNEYESKEHPPSFYRCGDSAMVKSSPPSRDDDNASVSSAFESSDTDQNNISDVQVKRETQIVVQLKLTVLFVLICSTIVVATTVYYYLSRSENSQFVRQFNDDSNKLLDGFATNLDKSFGLLDSLAVNFVSFSHAANQTWPFITMPDFAVRMSKVVPLTAALNINFLPIVTPEHRRAWEAYTLSHDHWVDESMAVQDAWGHYFGPIVYNGTKNGIVHSDFANVPYNVSRYVLPLWQNFPVIGNTSWTYNVDWMTVSFSQSYAACIDEHKAVVSIPYMIPKPDDPLAQAETNIWADYYRVFLPPDEEPKEPMSDLVYPIVEDISNVYVAGADNYTVSNNKVVGMLVASMYWREMIRRILPDGSNGIQIAFDNPCAESFTYQINGPNVSYMGVGDHHNSKYDVHIRQKRLHTLFAQDDSEYSGAKMDEDHCHFTLRVYPSDVMQAEYTTQNPMYFTTAVILIFGFMSFVFQLYDSSVESRQRKVMKNAIRSSAIVSSLFPSTVRDRLYPAEEQDPTRSREHTSGIRAVGAACSPIAEVYPETTVLFADIVGFTAWSSTRQPTQVFHLLETLYGAFDEIAKRRGVFKVETIGDCYVAVAGLPTPKNNHAVIMARFANDCQRKMSEVVNELEKSLGTGTANLQLRVGLNSGPTTGGVLRGEKSRFQLFGDTVNTAARMESNGTANRIHVSETTAYLLGLAGHGHWLTRRKEQINYKGKGIMTTYYCDVRSPSSAVKETMQVIESSPISGKRLIDWNVSVFTDMLQDIAKANSTLWNPNSNVLASKPIDEVAEVLTIMAKNYHGKTAPHEVCLRSEVSAQLREYVTSIARMYPTRPFHNFEHCSRVAKSTKKLLDNVIEHENDRLSCHFLADPLTRFAIVFAAFIHDVDHPGVPNAQLVQERNALAIKYNGKSAAEQNSVDIAWELLMQPQFTDLRGSIFVSETEIKRFRQLVVNVVLATDLFDKDLQAMRTARWNKLHATIDTASLTTDATLNVRMTVIIDLIIQASDVSHTMQHFEVYKKWNMRLFNEMYAAYKSGRASNDPTERWFDGEIWFFDEYVIPLAKKLQAFGVFGPVCDEMLRNAQCNRMEWQLQGRDIIRVAMEANLVLEAPFHI